MQHITTIICDDVNPMVFFFRCVLVFSKEEIKSASQLTDRIGKMKQKMVWWRRVCRIFAMAMGIIKKSARYEPVVPWVPSLHSPHTNRSPDCLLQFCNYSIDWSIRLEVFVSMLFDSLHILLKAHKRQCVRMNWITKCEEVFFWCTITQFPSICETEQKKCVSQFERPRVIAFCVCLPIQ